MEPNYVVGLVMSREQDYGSRGNNLCFLPKKNKIK